MTASLMAIASMTSGVIICVIIARIFCRCCGSGTCDDNTWSMASRIKSTISSLLRSPTGTPSSSVTIFIVLPSNNSVNRAAAAAPPWSGVA